MSGCREFALVDQVPGPFCSTLVRWVLVGSCGAGGGCCRFTEEVVPVALLECLEACSPLGFWDVMGAGGTVQEHPGQEEPQFPRSCGMNFSFCGKYLTQRKAEGGPESASEKRWRGTEHVAFLLECVLEIDVVEGA